MKTTISILATAAILFPGTMSAQVTVAVHLNVKADTIKVEQYKPEKSSEETELKTLILRMDYGDEKILNKKDAKVLKSANILSVDLVYTAYPDDDTLIDELNKRRLLELYFLNADVFKQPMVKWKLIKQTSCKNETQARKMFHGIVIRYIKIIQYKPGSVNEMKARVKRKEFLPGDSTVLKIFKRNPNWKKELIVTDFTGSMSPYYDQVFIWYHLKNFKEPVNFAFFNDGNRTPDHLKKTGKTGGIYMFSTDNMDTLFQRAYTTIMAGDGGDTPENDVEAILAAIKKFDKAKEIILIADNWAAMRDYSLIKLINKPVKVILCGTDYGINPQYLDLAKETGGSIHTMNEDITTLAKTREGEKIKIGKFNFLIRGGKFVQLFEI